MFSSTSSTTQALTYCCIGYSSVFVYLVLGQPLFWGSVLFLSQRSNTTSMSSVFHFCSLLSLPAEASFLGAIVLPSFPHPIFLAVVFCFGPTENKVGMVARLTTRLTGSLPPTFIKSAKKGGLDFSFFIFSDTF